nr:F420-dependent reductase [uncultured bacterium]
MGLPTTVPELDVAGLTEWAGTAEALGFASLGVLDRLVYENVEPVVALAAAASVTARIDLAATVLIAPYRRDVAVLAKQLASVALLSDGRLTVGVSAGLRQDDYAVDGASYGDRGRRLDAQIDALRRLWSGSAEGVGPRTGGATPSIVVGGNSDAALRRAARLGDGWVAGSGTPAQFSDNVATLRSYWAEERRVGSPRTRALVFYALGEHGPELAEAHLHRYYGFLGPHAEVMAAKAVTDPERLRDVIAAYGDAGCAELVFFPCSGDPRQLELLAKAAL